jgi:hypothetical protein
MKPILAELVVVKAPQHETFKKLPENRIYKQTV